MPPVICSVVLMLVAAAAEAGGPASQAPSSPQPGNDPDFVLPAIGAPARARRVLFELRLAEAEPVRGLTIDGTVKGSGKKIYPHYDTVLANSDVLRAAVVRNGGRREVELVFTPEGAAKLADRTSRHQGRPLAIVLDGEIAAVLTARTPATDRVVFGGDLSEADVTRIAAGLNNW